MYRLRHGCAPFHVLGCALSGLLLAGCAMAIGGPSPQPPIAPTELLGVGVDTAQAHEGGALRHITSAEQDLVVARAIAAHEMRHP